ncbi:MAG TPA: response regulator [Candidatus Paceibacterota bacterium]
MEELLSKPKDYCVLIVDDEESLLNLYRTKLTREGFRAIVARNGLEALAVAERENPDLILMDMKMPVMDGIAAVKKLRENSKTKNMHIMYLTAFSDPTASTIETTPNSPRCIKKGIGLEEFTNEIKRYLNA